MKKLFLAAALAALPLQTATALPLLSTCAPAEVHESLAEDWKTLLKVTLTATSLSGISWMNWDFQLDPDARHDYEQILSFFKVNDLKANNFYICQSRHRGSFCYSTDGGILWLCRIDSSIGK